MKQRCCVAYGFGFGSVLYQYLKLLMYGGGERFKNRCLPEERKDAVAAGESA